MLLMYIPLLSCRRTEVGPEYTMRVFYGDKLLDSMSKFSPLSSAIGRPLTRLQDRNAVMYERDEQSPVLHCERDNNSILNFEMSLSVIELIGLISYYNAQFKRSFPPKVGIFSLRVSISLPPGIPVELV